MSKRVVVTMATMNRVLSEDLIPDAQTITEKQLLLSVREQGFTPVAEVQQRVTGPHRDFGQDFDHWLIAAKVLVSADE